jgi:hypothetical protein
MSANRKIASQAILDFMRVSAAECLEDDAFIETHYSGHSKEEVVATLEASIYEELN